MFKDMTSIACPVFWLGTWEVNHSRKMLLRIEIHVFNSKSTKFFTQRRMWTNANLRYRRLKNNLSLGVVIQHHEAVLTWYWGRICPSVLLELSNLPGPSNMLIKPSVHKPTFSEQNGKVNIIITNAKSSIPGIRKSRIIGVKLCVESIFDVEKYENLNPDKFNLQSNQAWPWKGILPRDHRSSTATEKHHDSLLIL